MSMLHTDKKYPARPDPNPKPLAKIIPSACCACGSDDLGYPDPEGRRWCNPCVAAAMMHADPAQVDVWRRDLPRAAVPQAPRSARRYNLQNAETGESEAKPFGVTDVRAFDCFVAFGTDDLYGKTDNRVPPGVSLTLVSRPQVMFQLGAFVVPESIAHLFTLTDAKIGKDSLFVSDRRIPCEVFRPDPEGRCVSFAPKGRRGLCQIAQDLSVCVTNISGQTSDFRAAWFGNNYGDSDAGRRDRRNGLLLKSEYEILDEVHSHVSHPAYR